MKPLAIILCLLLCQTLQRLVSGKQNITLSFVVLYSEASSSILNIVEQTIEKLTAGNDSLHFRVKHMCLNETNLLANDSNNDDWLALIEDKPDLVFEFTGGEATSSALYARATLKNTTVPMVTTNPAHSVLESIRQRVTPANATRVSYNSTLIYFNSPSYLAEIAVLSILKREIISSATFFSTIGGKKDCLPRYDERFSEPYYIWGTTSNPNTSTLNEEILERETRAVFLYGSILEITEILEEAVEYERNLFSKYHSWWIIPTDIGVKFKLPARVERVIVLTPQLDSRVSSRIASAGTRKITELFYMDIINQTTAAVSSLKALNVHASVFSETQVRGAIREKLRKQQYLGYYLRDEKTNDWYPNISILKMELHDAQGVTSVGIVNLPSRGREAAYRIDNTSAFMNNLPTDILTATIVVDSPFVIKNESCFLAKNKIGYSLECYYGYAIDILQEILTELPLLHISILFEDVYGVNDTKNGVTGASKRLGHVSQIGKGNKKIKRVKFGIGAFAVKKARNRLVKMTQPFFVDKKSNETYGFAFEWKQGIYAMRFSHVIDKLQGEGYMEKLYVKWFHKYRCNCGTSDHL